jgi:hypothetical protein
VICLTSPLPPIRAAHLIHLCVSFRSCHAEWAPLWVNPDDFSRPSSPLASTVGPLSKMPPFPSVIQSLSLQEARPTSRSLHPRATITSSVRYPVTLYVTPGPRPNNVYYDPTASVVNLGQAGCPDVRDHILTAQQTTEIVLGCANEVVYFTWSNSAGVGSASNVTVAAYENPDLPLTLTPSVSRTLSFELRGGASQTRSVLVSFAIPTVFTYSYTVNTSYVDVSCRNGCDGEDCSRMTPSTTKELLVSSTTSSPQLVTLNITSFGREGCLRLPAGHVCSGLHDWVSPFSVGPLTFGVPNDTLITLDRHFPNVSSTCRDTVRRTVCLATIQACPESGQIVPPPCRILALSCPMSRLPPPAPIMLHVLVMTIHSLCLKMEAPRAEDNQRVDQEISHLLTALARLLTGDRQPTLLLRYKWLFTLLFLWFSAWLASCKRNSKRPGFC